MEIRSRGRVVAGLCAIGLHRRRHDERRVGHDAPPDSGAAGTASGPSTNELGATLNDGDFGENYTPDDALLQQALGGAGSLPSEERARNIALATSPGRRIPVDYDLAMKCWEDNGCDTGTGGDLKVGLADGFGGNIARQTSRWSSSCRR